MIRGIASIAKLVTPASASARLVSAEVSGARWPIRTWPERSLSISSLVGSATLTTTSAPQAASPGPTPAPASVYSGSGWPAPSPAPDSTATSTSLLLSELTASGVSATRRSPSRDSLGTPTFKARESVSEAEFVGSGRRGGRRDARQLGQALERCAGAARAPG